MIACLLVILFNLPANLESNPSLMAYSVTFAVPEAVLATMCGSYIASHFIAGRVN